MKHSLNLIHGNHQYVFTYFDGDEQNVLVALEVAANNKELNFDLFDAAVLSYQIGQRRKREDVECS